MTFEEQAKYRWSVTWGYAGWAPAFSLDDARKLAKTIRSEGHANVKVCKRLREEETLPFDGLNNPGNAGGFHRAGETPG